MRSLLAALSEPATRTVIGLSSISALCAQLAPVVSVVAGLLAIGYGIYRWVRDVRGSTCDRSGCANRQRRNG